MKKLKKYILWTTIPVFICLVLFLFVQIQPLRLFFIFLVFVASFMFLMEKFGEHRKWISPYLWTFVIICAFILVILPDFGKTPDFFIDYNIGLSRMMATIIIFCIAYFTPWILNLVTAPALALFDKETWGHDFILMLTFVFKSLVLGFIWAVILLLLLPSFGGLL